MLWTLLIQVGLLICWYTVPAMATVSAWLIFLPLLLLAAVWGVMVVVLGFCAAIGFVVTRR